MDKKEQKKRLLIYAHYYIPDTASTGQILRELAEGLSDSFEVTVICTVPSYLGTVDEEYRQKRFYREEINGVHILRVRVPGFDKTKLSSRMRNILAYAVGAAFATFQVGKQDYVFSISQPPVLGGLLGVWGKWMKHAKYIYNIQDFNPEQVKAVGYSKNRLLIGLMMWLDKFSCRRSNLVVTVGRDLEETLKTRFRGKRIPPYAVINNWVNEKETCPLPADHEKVVAFKRKYGLEDKFVIMYLGNIGLYYDLGNLIKVMKRFRKGCTHTGELREGPRTKDGREVVFAFVGAGSVQDMLVEYRDRHHMENVIFIPYQEQEDLVYSLNAGDVHWCVNAKGIKGVSVPSKLYGIMAVGKPVLGVLEKETEARKLIEETGCGLVTDPGNYEQVAKEIQWFIDHAGTDELTIMGQRGRTYLEKHLTQDVSVRKYKEAILNL
ncbi:MAG: glycosyltransferase family 4 protein [Lachnospiraceae bacterium]|nr:glycosyltransferase family 4 protein [Lachnospiraceae bacterium]